MGCEPHGAGRGYGGSGKPIKRWLRCVCFGFDLDSGVAVRYSVAVVRIRVIAADLEFVEESPDIARQRVP